MRRTLISGGMNTLHTLCSSPSRMNRLRRSTDARASDWDHRQFVVANAATISWSRPLPNAPNGLDSQVQRLNFDAQI